MGPGRVTGVAPGLTGAPCSHEEEPSRREREKNFGEKWGEISAGRSTSGCRRLAHTQSLLRVWSVPSGVTNHPFSPLSGVTYAAKGYFDALVKMGELASESQGSKELGKVPGGDPQVSIRSSCGPRVGLGPRPVTGPSSTWIRFSLSKQKLF